MSQSDPLATLRDQIREHYLVPEAELMPALIKMADLDEPTRRDAQSRAAEFVTAARASAERSGLIDKFLQEYGLSTAEGVTLMRLAEALLRTPDAATADALIEDKIEAGDWASHKGKSPFPLVNFSTRALMLTAAWLDDVEAKDPLRKMAARTKAALDRLGEPVIRASVGQAMRIMGEHFVLGETIASAMKRAQRYGEKGYVFSFDMLGEAAHTEKDALKYFDDYMNAIKAISEYSTHDRPALNPGISVKLSALHPRYEFGKKERVLKELGERVTKLALQAKAANMGFNIDAEEADRLDISLDIIESLMRNPDLAAWEGFGVVVQSYQRRASFVLDWLATLSRETNRLVMVRLVKGAYWDSEIKRAQVMGLESYPVFTRKVLTDVSFLSCARKLLSNTDVFYPQFATHNALTAAMVQAMAGDFDDYELQRLHGMGEALHDKLVESGTRSRIYAPVGGHKELLPYLVRRLLENGANSSFVNQLIDPDMSVDDVVADPYDEIAELETFPNPHIPAPRDYFDGERLVAKGWDETHPPTAASMSPDARAQLQAIKACPIIDGETRRGAVENATNPANGNDIIGEVTLTASEDVSLACEKAATFAGEWAATPVTVRADAIRKTADLLEERGEHFMRLAVFEAGKSWPDAIAEVREAVDFLRYYPNRAEELKAEPLGVVACISPWNFPLAIFLGQVSASLAAGNCVIAKPAEQTPLIAFEAIKLLHEAGVPAGALHFLPGDGPSVGAPLIANPNVNGVVFTGSTNTAQAIKRTLVASGRHDAALIAETGGINAMIVDSTALLEQAVTDTVDSAFQSAGQRCSACRVVCVQEDITDRFNEMLAGAMAELAVGDPSKLSTDVGPVIDEEARGNIQRNIERLEQEARLIARAPEVETGLGGTFIQPAAFEINSLSDLKQEIFGPVLHVVTFEAENLEALVDEINALGYGLTMGVHTRIDETMERVAQRARVGNVYVNRNQIGAVVGVQPFGGEGLSGTGPKAGGPHYLRALTKRVQSEGDFKIEFNDGQFSAKTDGALNQTLSNLIPWANERNKKAIFERAAGSLSAEHKASMENAAALFEKEFAETEELPGPTGESNTLKQRGRGIVLCLGGGDWGNQIAKSLAAGNCVIADKDQCEPFASALAESAPDVICPMDFSNGIPKSLLLDNRISAVVYDGGSEGRAAIEAVLAERKGPIIPLLSSLDEPWRFATERTLTINTTAAGGDVRLLSLSE
ncbi:bifunctional proline dehydrogenase/L-glutamate gamma-semialdehyde dehydrogenase PutA [Hyphococcus flavus]|uniref:Bifunctional protein PutA n=1 Tax=Hyphococcus flavus TaxID=1866326 RepID=A0AAE9ZJ20_9PROT|nr:bifunctional proline dehydrogenase/L-glutamate gamma-semialdehyde dehydrogenase PutA [Hyphococcus flavus]WDI31335.1 bifunctional proline dehydrogenase/L-glutamate gamma-semialdehyde dehydrogenase PutA [Hyphococcus flavus]